MNTLGTIARQLRVKEEITREQLAERTGLTADWLARLEQGQLSQTELAVPRLRIIAKALGYSLVGFLREAGLIESEEVTALSGDPGLRELVANYAALSPDEREAVDTLIRSLTKKGK